MRAELRIAHKSGNLVTVLQGALGPNDGAALGSSAMMLKSPAAAGAISYAANGPGWVVMAWPTPGQLYLYVESSGGRLRRAAGDVWDIIRNGGSSLEPSLTSLVLLDEDANDELAAASVGLGANLDRPELRYTLLLGIGTLIWLAIALPVFDATSDLVLGAIPAILAAIYASGVLIADTRKKSLVWR